MIVSKLEITFDDDLVENDTFNHTIKEDDGMGGSTNVVYTWTYKTGLNSAGDVFLYDVTSTTGEAAAIGFVEAFLRDVTESYKYEITRNGNNVVIIYPTPEFTGKFVNAPSHADITASVTNDFNIAESAFIKSGSPYIIHKRDNTLENMIVDIYIYKGEQGTDRPPNITYTLNSRSLPTPFQGDNITQVDVSPLINDFIEVEFDGSYDVDAVWVDYQVKAQYTTGNTEDMFVYGYALDGYGYYEDGVNPSFPENGILINNNKVIKLQDEPFRLPVLQDKVNKVSFLIDNDVIYSKNITVNGNSTDIVRYISNAENGVDNFRERVLADGGEISESVCLDNLSFCYNLDGVDKVLIEHTEGISVLNIENVEEFKYTPHKVTFLNKEGVLQDLWFFKVFKEKIKVDNKKFNDNNMLLSQSYSTSRHHKRLMNSNAEESFELNSGYYPESYNDTFKQLLLSEVVWVEIDGKTLPVNITTSNLNIKTGINDKLISYKIEFDYAFNKINNIF